MTSFSWQPMGFKTPWAGHPDHISSASRNWWDASRRWCRRRGFTFRFYGVLAPNAKLRPLVVPEAPEKEEASLTGGACCHEEERRGQSVRRRWVPWAKQLLKVFAVDVFQCPTCDGRMQRIAWITQPRVMGMEACWVLQAQAPPDHAPFGNT